LTQSSPNLHVVSLRYALRKSDHCSYVTAPPVDFETGEAHFRLDAGELICEMKSHFSTAEAARAVVEPILRAWEADADLRWSRDELRFKFTSADIIDLTPLPPGTVRGIVASASGMAITTGTVFVHVTRSNYPDPPGSFRLNGVAQEIFDHYNRYLNGRALLTVTAYYCLTVLQREANNKQRDAVGAKYSVHPDVLSSIGRLSSKHGDSSTARKATATQPLTEKECAWLEAAVKKLILQVGTPPAERSLLKMADLPAL
jgi:hypothetical protein